MTYSVEQVITYDNHDEFFPKRKGKWIVRNAAGEIVYQFKFSYRGDLAEWDNRHYWQGPADVRVSDDGTCVECLHQDRTRFGASEPEPNRGRTERHPLPPATRHIEEE
jgi:hypothetical protein